jgi:hypothetical protein
LKLAAEALAPHDLRRALRLWERAQQFTWDRDDSPDTIYRAAAAASETDKAATLIASIRDGRASAYLDLATRAKPGEVPYLLRQAEMNLTGIKQAERLHCLARLAAAWAPSEPDQSHRYLAMILAEVDREPADEEVIRGLVQAAAELAEVDPATAHHFLDRLEAADVNGLVDESLLHAAALWAAWGSSDKARRLLGRLTDWNNTVWTKIRAAAVLGEFDKAAALRMIEEAHTTIPSATAAYGLLSFSLSSREGDLETVALELAKYDLSRAEAIAREIDTVRWSMSVKDRYTTLARIAHLHLDAGNVAEAALLLEESHRFAESAPPLADARPTGPFRRTTETSPPEADLDFDVTYHIGRNQRWQTLREERLYLNPAQVVLAMSPGPSQIGNPYTWARTVRVFAEAIADQDLPRAVHLVRSLSDAGERAVGLAAMFQVAAAGHDRGVHQRLWEEFNTALDGIERFESNLSDQDVYAIAYVRPDHRARFDAAIRIMPYEADFALDMLEQSGATYLTNAFWFSLVTWASGVYASSVTRGDRPVPALQQLHEIALTAPLVGHDELLINILRARVAANEHLITTATGRAPERLRRPLLGLRLWRRRPAAHAARRSAAAPLPPEIDDPLYAGLVDLAAPTGDEPVGHAFAQRLRGLLDGPRLPAAAALAALAAQMTGDSGQIRDLCAEIIAATRNSPPATRVDTLLQFAVSPVLTGLVDAADLLADAWQDEAFTGLFPVLVTQHPATALRLLYDTVEENWDLAVALLEHGAETLVNALGTGVAALLHSSILRALECTSPDGAVPPVVDGVHVA